MLEAGLLVKSSPVYCLYQNNCYLCSEQVPTVSDCCTRFSICYLTNQISCVQCGELGNSISLSTYKYYFIQAVSPPQCKTSDDKQKQSYKDQQNDCQQRLIQLHYPKKSRILFTPSMTSLYPKSSQMFYLTKNIFLNTIPNAVSIIVWNTIINISFTISRQPNGQLSSPIKELVYR